MMSSHIGTMCLDVLSKCRLQFLKRLGERREDDTHNHLSDIIPFLWFLPQTVIYRQQVGHVHFFSVLHESRRAQQSHDVLPPSVTHIYIPSLIRTIYAYSPERVTHLMDAIQHTVGHCRLVNLFIPLCILLIGDLPFILILAFVLVSSQQHLVKMGITLHVSTFYADHEAVPQCLQALTLSR